MNQNKIKHLIGISLCSLVLTYPSTINPSPNLDPEILNCYKISQEDIEEIKQEKYSLLLIYNSNPGPGSVNNNQASLAAFTSFSRNTQNERENNTYLFDYNELEHGEQFIQNEFNIHNPPALIFYCDGELFRTYQGIPLNYGDTDWVAAGLEKGYEVYLKKCEKKMKKKRNN
ncbi:hypothetical protein HN385_04815 [archaeon]|jgi:hypothetical protein|nr:hypothetical protein [archaeon]MBT3451040.1 hypothetical protein [archaeon]MBT6869130.1 hypothetical protein [archaeon]MBT7192777.1 hypothetical protein [archaeon]MBT7381317.1 hypothetical protein [archaeon]